MKTISRLVRGPLGAALLFFALGFIFLGGYAQPTPGQFLGGGDMVGQWIQILRLAQAEVLHGRLPLWNPYLAGGLPLLANPQLGLFYPPYWVFWLTSFEQGVVWIGAFHLGWMSLGTYLFARRLGLSPVAALSTALIMGFNGFFTVRVAEGHPGFIGSVAWLPWMLWAHHRSVDRGTWRSGLWLGLAFTGALLAGNPAGAMLALFGLGLWVALELALPEAGQSRAAILKPFALAIPFAVGLSAIQLLPTLEYLSLSARSATSYEFASQYSLPAAHLLSLVLPNFFGEPYRLGYWGEFPHIEYMYYPGVTAVTIAALTWWGRSKLPPRLLKWLIFGGLGLLLALGPAGGLHWLLYEVFLPIRYVRVPARFMLFAVFALAWLCGAAVDCWIAEPDRPLDSRGAWATAVGGLAALAAVAFLFYTLQPAEDARAYHIGSDLMRAALFVALSGVILARRSVRRPALVGALVAVVLLADLWGYGWRELHLTSADLDPAWKLARSNLATTAPYPTRILPWGLKIEQQNRGQDVGLASTNAYDPLILERARRFIDSVADPRATTFDLLNADWLLSTDSGAWLDTGAFTPTTTADGFGLYARPSALPRAWVTADSQTVSDLDEALAVIHAKGFDPRVRALLEDETCPAGTGGAAEITSFNPTQITVTVRGTGLLVLSEAWYPGWTATIEGSPARVLIADGMLRGVCLTGSAAPRTIRFEFRPVLLFAGSAVTAVTIAIGLWLAARNVRRRPGTVETRL